MFLKRGRERERVKIGKNEKIGFNTKKTTKNAELRKLVWRCFHFLTFLFQKTPKIEFSFNVPETRVPETTFQSESSKKKLPKKYKKGREKH